jgi:hypothetical protein
MEKASDLGYSPNPQYPPPQHVKGMNETTNICAIWLYQSHHVGVQSALSKPGTATQNSNLQESHKKEHTIP